jgi:hypothetical protein
MMLSVLEASERKVFMRDSEVLGTSIKCAATSHQRDAYGFVRNTYDYVFQAIGDSPCSSHRCDHLHFYAMLTLIRC